MNTFRGLMTVRVAEIGGGSVSECESIQPCADGVYDSHRRDNCRYRPEQVLSFNSKKKKPIVPDAAIMMARCIELCCIFQIATTKNNRTFQLHLIE